MSPSSELRKWYGHAESRFDEFADRYRGELASPAGRAALEDLRGRIADRDVTLLTATKELASSHLTVLAEVLAHP